MLNSNLTKHLLGVKVFLGGLLISGCSLQPVGWNPMVKPELTGVMAENDKLTSTQRIDLDGWYGPEDIAVDRQGNIYAGVHKGRTSFEEGCIIKVDRNNQVTAFAETGGWVTGLHFDQVGNLIACDQKRGLISVNPQGEITVLASEDENGNKFLIPNDVDIASNGIIYFSNTSSKVSFNQLNARKIIMEMKPDGGLYSYNPSTKEVKTLIDGAYFGNGVAVSKEDDFVLLVDLAKYQVRRYWLKGEKKGQIDIFIENLPGLPNGISRRKDGSFWLGFTTRRNDMLDFVQPKPFLKQMVFALPMWLQPPQEAYGMIMHLSEQGEVIEMLYDPSGDYVPEASSIEEHHGYLYIGGDLTDYIGRYRLEADHQLD